MKLVNTSIPIMGYWQDYVLYFNTLITIIGLVPLETIIKHTWLKNSL
jgi:hypothetical protein